MPTILIVGGTSLTEERWRRRDTLVAIAASRAVATALATTRYSRSVCINDRLNPSALRQLLAALNPRPRQHLTRLAGLVALDAQHIKPKGQGAVPPTHSC